MIPLGFEATLALTPKGASRPPVTVMILVSVLLPSTVVTVIVAVPGATAVTTPPSDTVATASLLVLHVMFWFVALEGVIVAMRVSVAPGSILTDVRSKDTPVTATLVGLTVMLEVAVLPPSSVLTVIIAVPGTTAVTTPFETVATEGLLVLQNRLWFVALEGIIVAARVALPPT